ncbi:MAG: hypothetical protein V1858_02900 [Candidatus Gottesmanbacteria bacterium]
MCQKQEADEESGDGMMFGGMIIGRLDQDTSWSKYAMENLEPEQKERLIESVRIQKVRPKVNPQVK